MEQTIIYFFVFLVIYLLSDFFMFKNDFDIKFLDPIVSKIFLILFRSIIALFILKISVIFLSYFNFYKGFDSGIWVLDYILYVSVFILFIVYLIKYIISNYEYYINSKIFKVRFISNLYTIINSIIILLIFLIAINYPYEFDLSSDKVNSFSKSTVKFLAKTKSKFKFIVIKKNINPDLNKIFERYSRYNNISIHYDSIAMNPFVFKKYGIKFKNAKINSDPVLVVINVSNSSYKIVYNKDLYKNKVVGFMRRTEVLVAENTITNLLYNLDKVVVKDPKINLLYIKNNGALDTYDVNHMSKYSTGILNTKLKSTGEYNIHTLSLLQDSLDKFKNSNECIVLNHFNNNMDNITISKITNYINSNNSCILITLNHMDKTKKNKSKIGLEKLLDSLGVTLSKKSIKEKDYRYHHKLYNTSSATTDEVFNATLVKNNITKNIVEQGGFLLLPISQVSKLNFNAQDKDIKSIFTNSTGDTFGLTISKNNSNKTKSNIIIIGNSDWVSNYFTSKNSLFYNTKIIYETLIEWGLGKDNKFDIQTPRPKVRRMLITSQIQTLLSYFIFLLPILTMIIGFVVYRKRNY